MKRRPYNGYLPYNMTTDSHGREVPGHIIGIHQRKPEQHGRVLFEGPDFIITEGPVGNWHRAKVEKVYWRANDKFQATIKFDPESLYKNHFQVEVVAAPVRFPGLAKSYIMNVQSLMYIISEGNHQIQNGEITGWFVMHRHGQSYTLMGTS